MFKQKFKGVLVLLLVFSVVIIGFNATMGTVSKAATVAALMADSVVDSIGINNHWDYTTSPDYTHATGSIALSDLAKQKAILSAGELQRQNHTIKTGEQYSMLKTADGLESVYVDPGGPRYGYHVMNWFDEYPVTFGINAKQQAKFLQSIGFHYPNGSFFLDLHTDGEQIIGPKVKFGT